MRLGLGTVNRPEPQRGRWRWAGGRLALTLAAAVMMTTVTPAQAHQSTWTASGWMWGPNSSFCVHGDVIQDHDYHAVTTRTYGPNCASQYQEPAGWIAQAQQYFWEPDGGGPGTGYHGTYCGYNGWNYNSFSTFEYTKVVYAVLSVVCYQSDPIYHTKPIWTSIDSWQYGVDQGANWQGNTWRPATYHYYPRYN